MNLRHFSIALLVSALPYLAQAESAGITLTKEDFVSAERVSPAGETLISLKLSKSGKAKFKKLNHEVGKKIHSEIAGVSSDLTLRDAIQDDRLQAGPYADSDAQKILATINKH